MEQIDCHRPCPYIRVECPSLRNEHHNGEGHGKADRIADGAAQNTFCHVLFKKIIVIPTVEYFDGK